MIALGERSYIDDKGRNIFINTGLGQSEYGVFYTNNGVGIHRIVSKNLPMVKSIEECQNNLDIYAKTKRYKLYEEQINCDSNNEHKVMPKMSELDRRLVIKEGVKYKFSLYKADFLNDYWKDSVYVRAVNDNEIEVYSSDKYLGNALKEDSLNNLHSGGSNVVSIKDKLTKGIMTGLDDMNEKGRKEIDVNLIIENEKNIYGIRDIESLANDINEIGLLDDLVVEPIENGRYKIISGHRRFAAIKLLGWTKVSCNIREDLDDIKSEIALHKANIFRELTENEKRKQIEELDKCYQELKKRGEKVPGKIREIIAADTGLSSTQVGRYQKVNKDLIPELKTLLDEEKITLSNAAEFASLSEEGQKEVLSILQQNINITKGEAKNLADRIKLQVEENKKLTERNKTLEKRWDSAKEEVINIKGEIDKLKLEQTNLEEKLREEIVEELQNNNSDEESETVKALKKELISSKEKALELQCELDNKTNSLSDKPNTEINIEEIKMNTELNILLKDLNSINSKIKNKFSKKDNDCKLSEENKILLDDFEKSFKGIKGLLESFF